MNIVDIPTWDLKVRDKFRSEREKIPILQREINILDKVLSGSISPEERQTLLDQKVKKSNLVQDLTLNSSLLLYSFEAQNFVDKYHFLIKNMKPRPFVRTKESMRQEEIDNQEILHLSENYISLLKQFNHILGFELPVIKGTSLSIVCNCGSREFQIDEGRAYYCIKCGTQVKEQVHQRSSKNENGKVKSNNTIRETHMKNCMSQVQGKQKVIIPEALQNDCKKYIQENRMENCYPVDIRDVLRKTGWRDQYENANLIWSVIFSKNCPDFSHLEQAILEDFRLIQTEYDKIIEEMKETRKSFMNYPFTLYHILTRRGFDCDLRFFHMLKESRIDWLNDIMSKIFARLKWNNFKPLIVT